MTSPSAPPSSQSWASRALNWFGASRPEAHAPGADDTVSLSADLSGATPSSRGPRKLQGPPQHSTQPSVFVKAPRSPGPPGSSRGSLGGPPRGPPRFSMGGKEGALHAAHSSEGGPPPVKSTVKVGGRNPSSGGSAGGSPACMDLKNIHKFVIDLNKRAAAKQQGLPLPPPNVHAFEHKDKNTAGILAFARLPPHDTESSVAESPAMALIRETLGESNCPSIEGDCLFMASVTAACRRHKDNEEYAKILIRNQLLQGKLLLPLAVRVAAETLLSSLASQWKRLCELESDEDAVAPKGPRRALQREVQLQKAEIRDLILRKCQAMVSVCSTCLSRTAVSATSRVFHLRMLGAIFRFLSSFCDGVASYQCQQLANTNYKAALQLAERELPPYHVLRIEAAASFAAFLHQDLQEQQAALEVTRKAFREATDAMHAAPDVDFNAIVKSQKMLMRLINWWSHDSRRVLISSYVEVAERKSGVSAFVG
ncbi:hypothetical protein Esti_000421 [Eimeria stiedai]